MLLSRQSGKVHYLAVLGAFGLTLVLIAGSGVLAYRNVLTQDATTAEVIRSHDILQALDQIEAAMVDAETGQRGYLLTNEDRFLEPWLAATGRGRVAAIGRPPVDALLAQVRSQLPADGAGQVLLARAAALTHEKLAELQRTIALHRAGQSDAALAIVRQGHGKRAMDALRGVLIKLREKELLQLARSERARGLAVRRTMVSGVAASSAPIASSAANANSTCWPTT